MATHTITFYLVRHGEAENNVRFLLNSSRGKKEYSLTEKGRKQASETAEYLATVGAEALFSSPILRAKETAEIISQATHLPVILDDRLWEVGMGKFEGKTHAELLKKYPQEEMRLVPDKEDDMESFLNVCSRLELFLEELKEKYTGKKVILVSHSDPLEQLYGILTHKGPGLAANGWYPKTGVATEVIYTYQTKEST